MLENAITMRLQERKKAFIAFFYLYRQLDNTIEALYQSELYTVFEFEKLACHYHVLQWRADRMEERLQRNYSSANMEDTIKWLKYGIDELQSQEGEKEAGEDDTGFEAWFRTLEEQNYMDAICENSGYEIEDSGYETEDYPEPDYLELEDYDDDYET